MDMVPAAVALIMKKGISWEPGPGSPEKTAHMRPPRKGPSARTPLARLCAVPFTAPLFDGGANLFTIACASTQHTVTRAHDRLRHKWTPFLPSAALRLVC